MKHYPATKFMFFEPVAGTRYKIIWFSCILIFTAINSFSQAKQFLYYFDKDRNSTEKAKSVFNGIGVYKDGLLELKVYNSLNKDLASIEHYTDSSLKLSEGLFQSYYTNASKEWEGKYLKGKEDGPWQKWDHLGHLVDSSIYNKGEKVMAVHMGYRKNGVLDSVIVHDEKTGQAQQTYYDSSGEVAKVMIESSFPGGAGAFSRYIMRQIERNQKELSADDYGTCIIKFIVDKNGRVTNPEATTMANTKLAEIILRAMRTSPRWKPAIQNGIRVNAYRIQPVTLTKLNLF